MIDWKPIETLVLNPVRATSSELRSAEVMLWVKCEHGYSGPAVGTMSLFRSVDGKSFKGVSVSGVGGYECEVDFCPEDVTHWAELPKGPGEE